MVLERQTVCALVAGLEHFPLYQIHFRAQIGQHAITHKRKAMLVLQQQIEVVRR